MKAQKLYLLEPKLNGEIDWLPTENVEKLPDGLYYAKDETYDDNNFAYVLMIHNNKWIRANGTNSSNIENWDFYAPVQSFDRPVWRNPGEAKRWMEVLVLLNGEVCNGFKSEGSSYSVRSGVHSGKSVDISKIDGYLPLSELVDLIALPTKSEPAPEPKKVIEIGGVDVEIEATDDPNRFVFVNKKGE